MLEKLKLQAQGMQGWLSETRRELHRHPEPGLQEYETAAIIRRHLDRMGIPYQQWEGHTSLVGLIRGGHPGPTVAIRADMDALPLQEPADRPYTSLNPGWMHACGHDAHVAILLGTADLLAGRAGDLHGQVKLLFQEAEETVGGADSLVRLGCMADPPVDAVFGLHVHTGLPVGVLETRYGAMNGSSDSLFITVHGHASHGAYPEVGVDAIVAAAQLITALQTLVSRNVSALDSVVLSFGTIQGGRAENILADEVRLEGTLRTLHPATREKAKARLYRLVTDICSGMGCTGEIRIEPGYNALINESDSVDLILDTARHLLGPANVLLKESPSLGVEDFSFFLDAAPGAFFHLGCSNVEKGLTSALHTQNFDLDEDCLPLGVLMESALILRYLKQEDLFA